MLLDDILPAYDFTEIHSIRVKASPIAIYQAVKQVTPADISFIMSMLLYLRSIPEKLAGRQGMTVSSHEPLLAQMINRNFVMLTENPPSEFVFGMVVPGTIGRVWLKSSNLKKQISDAKEFLALDDPDYLRVVANFLISDADQTGYVTVRTESRTKGLSEQARKKFTPYWRIIRPFSGLIRRVWLSSIKRRSEKQSKQ